jgi:hypothetical protein
MNEIYFRKGLRWAKVCGSRGNWTSAFGWKGQIEAIRLTRHHKKDNAIAWAKNWLDDQTASVAKYVNRTEGGK